MQTFRTPSGILVTVRLDEPELTDRLSGLLCGLYRANRRPVPGSRAPASEAVTEPDVRHARPTFAGLVAASGAGDAAGTFLSVAAVGVTPVAPTAWEAAR